MINLPFLSGKKIIVTIGEDGLILTLVGNKKTIARVFASSPAISDRREVHSLLLKNPSVPIYVLLDSIEQTYTKQTLPAVSPLAIGKLVKKRLERDFAKTDIKGAIPLGRDDKGRKDWLYTFVSTPPTPAILEWLEYFSSLQNDVAGIYLLPLEFQNIAKDINKVLFKGDVESRKWQVIVTFNKTGGFRQVVLQDGKVVFTRLIRMGNETMPDIIAGNVEQEIINTIDYLRRLGFSDDHGMNIILIVSSELKASLETTKIRGKPLLLFTPFDLAKELGYESAVSKTDKFADILLSFMFSGHRHVLKLQNPKAKSLDRVFLAQKYSSVAMMVIVPMIIIYSIMNIADIIGIKGDISKLEIKKSQTEKEWSEVKNTGEYDIDEAKKIVDVSLLVNKLKEENKNPLDILEKFITSDIKHTKLESFNWNYVKNYSVEGKEGQLSAIFNLKFIVEGSNLDQMFSSYDILVKRTNGSFKEFDISLSKLPETLTFDSAVSSLPMQLKLNSKDEEDNKKNRRRR